MHNERMPTRSTAHSAILDGAVLRTVLQRVKMDRYELRVRMHPQVPSRARALSLADVVGVFFQIAEKNSNLE